MEGLPGLADPGALVSQGPEPKDGGESGAEFEQVGDLLWSEAC